MADSGRRQVWPWYWGGRAAGGAKDRHPQLSWEWVVQRLTADPIYWLVTASPGECASARPVWGVWLDERVMFTSGSPRHRRDLAVNPNAAIHLGSGAEVVIVEGVVEVLHDLDLHRRFLDVYNAKYDWTLGARDDARVQTLVPQAVFAWTTDGDIPGKGFGSAVGKWVFTSRH